MHVLSSNKSAKSVYPWLKAGRAEVARRLLPVRKDLTGALTVSDGFLTGRTLTKPASTLGPDGLTARNPQGCLSFTFHPFNQRPATPYDTLRHVSLSVSSVKSSSQTQASPRNPTQPKTTYAPPR